MVQRQEDEHDGKIHKAQTALHLLFHAANILIDARESFQGPMCFGDESIDYIMLEQDQSAYFKCSNGRLIRVYDLGFGLYMSGNGFNPVDVGRYVNGVQVPGVDLVFGVRDHYYGFDYSGTLIFHTHTPNPEEVDLSDMCAENTHELPGRGIGVVHGRHGLCSSVANNGNVLWLSRGFEPLVCIVSSGGNELIGGPYTCMHVNRTAYVFDETGMLIFPFG